MNSLPLQRRLDALSRDMEGLRETMLAVAERVGVGPPADPAAAAEALIAARRARVEALGAGLFADPAWDMLLALFAAGERGQALSVAGLCAASDVAQTTALRWLDQLEGARLVIRGPDPADARRIRLSLSPEARDKMRELLRQTAAALAAPAIADG